MGYVRGSAAEPITAEQVRTMHLHTLSFEDGFLDSLIKMTREYIEDSQDIAIMEQTITEKMPGFSGSCLELSCYPVISVTSVKYKDADDVEQTIPASEYYARTTSLKGRIQFKSTYALPTISEDPEAVEVVYQAGHTTVPESFIHAIRLLVAKHHMYREDRLEETIPAILTSAEKILFPNRAILV